ncbi:MAG: histidine phosphatase family protein [Elusimicrobia bacterium]|nr:histidine phosphatase family protein [Elusimicrobiota bacterium]
MTLLLARHGECTASGTYCGRTDAPLTAKGREQAAALAHVIAPYPIAACFTSSLLRARETAQIALNGRGVPLLVDDRLREVDFGTWEGLTYAEIERGWPQLISTWLSDPSRVDIPAGEPFSSLRHRVRAFLSEHAQSASDDCVLIIAHGGPLAVIGLELLGRPDNEFFDHVPRLGSLRPIDVPLRKILPC